METAQEMNTTPFEKLKALEKPSKRVFLPFCHSAAFLLRWAGPLSMMIYKRGSELISAQTMTSAAADYLKF